MQKRFRREWIGILALLGLCGLGAFVYESSSMESERETPSAKRPRAEPAGPAELALVAPLELGSDLDGWEVSYIGAVTEGRLPLAVAHEGRKLGLEVVLSSDDGPEPAAATRRFHVYYRSRGAIPEDGAKLALALARVLAKNGAVDAPPGMTVYRDAGRDPWADGI